MERYPVLGYEHLVALFGKVVSLLGVGALQQEVVTGDGP